MKIPQQTFLARLFSKTTGERHHQEVPTGIHFLNENVLNYTKSFTKSQKLDLIAGLTYQKYTTKYTNISVSGFSNNITENYNLGAAQTINPPSSGISEWSLASW